MFNMAEFVKERDEALLSLDKRKIMRYARKYGAQVNSGDETVFWAGVHKAILGICSSTPEQRAKSADWLVSHGFTTEM